MTIDGHRQQQMMVPEMTLLRNHFESLRKKKNHIIHYPLGTSCGGHPYSTVGTVLVSSRVSHQPINCDNGKGVPGAKAVSTQCNSVSGEGKGLTEVLRK